jgi:hypothetical protein
LKSWRSFWKDSKHTMFLKIRYSNFKSCICGRCMTSWRMLFLSVWVHMVDWHVCITVPIWIASVLLMVERNTYFDCHRRWLHRKRPFRSNKKNFIKNTVVTKGLPKHLNATGIYAQLNNLVVNKKGDKCNTKCWEE